MKSRYYLFLLLIAVGLMSCRLGGVRGNGDIEVQERDIEAFSKLEASGAFEILVICGEDPSLKIRTDENLFQYVETDIRGDRLIIDSEKNLDPSDDVKVRITTPVLEGIELSGANEIIVREIDSEDFELEMSGATEAKLSGKVKRISIDASGASEIDNKDLIAEAVRIDASGATEAVVYASQRLKANVSGAGDVKFYGDAKDVDTNISGAGSVKRAK
jgi:hypothetical protein